MMQQQTGSPHSRGWQVYKDNFAQVLGLLAFQLLLRLVAFSPMLYAALTGQFFSLTRDHALAFGFLFSLPLYVIIVMPFRFQAAARMAGLHGDERSSEPNMRNYLKWLPAALVRLLLALPFLLPFLAFIILFYYYMRVPGFNESLLVIQTLGNLIGGDYPAGILLIGLIGILSALLAGFVWKRGLAFEHQPVPEQGIRESLRRGKETRRHRHRHINRTVFINMLLTLPAILGVLGVLLYHLLSMPRMGMLVMDFMNAVSVVLTFKFPINILYMVLIVLAVLWLPPLLWRKLALSAVLARPARREDA
jgi:hypothetical protein